MPELPEVETTLRGIKPHIIHQSLRAVVIRHPRLRWPIPKNLSTLLAGQTLDAITRRGKYLLLSFNSGTLILHLGMSGRLRVLTEPTPAGKHDHVDLVFQNRLVRFTDPRRFGALLFTDEDPALHPLLANMGIEPLTADFNGAYLFKKSTTKKVPVKSFIMDGRIVAGVGNIYATESLFRAGIHPMAPAGTISKARYEKLAQAIKLILQQAIEKGGTTLKDFAGSDGSPGYFRVELAVYGQEGNPCPRCKRPLQGLRIAQRSTVYCEHCQR